MYKGKLVKYYDDLYHNKDYSKESKFIEDNSELNKVLDVGCGTGTHIENLCKDGRTFIGIDPELEILEIANTKFRNHSNIFLKNCYVEELTEEKDFDTIISMFNVVNHILDRKDLESYFKTISELLSEDGTFIFDCFNSDAIVDDETRETFKEVNSSSHGGKYIIKNTTDFDYDTGYMRMSNLVRVYHLDDEVDSFDYTLEHRIWLWDFLKELIENNNMEVEKIVSNSDYNNKASKEDLKITFVCKRRNNNG
tara:strand:+ start:3469 stop:4224 length:756 start_codon:yes stop_codon:yes gene_type:complete